MKTRILELLKNAGTYCSGEEISEMLGCSRNTVWKLVNKLKEEGYEIDSVTHKGYKLLTEPDLVVPEQISDGLKTTTMGKQIFFKQVSGSTNEDAKEGGSNGDREGCLYIAELQLSGKGRRGKGWISQPGEGIYMSLLLRPSLLPADVTQITLIAGLAVCYAINECADVRAYIKWPNDIVCNGKKICGILTEMVAEMEAVDYAVVGIGINVNNETFPKEIGGIATSLFIEAGKKVRRKTLAQAVLFHFERLYEKFISARSLTHIIDAYKKVCVTYDADVQTEYNKEEVRGHCTDILPTGELVIISDGGRKYVLNAGEVSVRGMYGYT